MNKKTTNSEKPIVISIGELLWDIFPEGKEIGGAPANFAYHCHLLGANSYIISRVGSDNLGIKAIEILKKKGINTENIDFDKKHPSGVATVDINDNGQPTFTIHKDVAWDYILLKDKTFNLIKKANAICFGTLALRHNISKNTILNIINRLPLNCLKIFDINLRQKFYTKKLIYDLLKKADVLKINNDELQVVTDMFFKKNNKSNEKKILINILKKFDLKLIALTKGSEGSLLVSNDQEIFHPCFSTKIIDTVGAGDSFTASLTIGLLKKNGNETVIKEANRYASFICSKKGGMPEVNDYKKNQNLIRSHTMENISLVINKPEQINIIEKEMLGINDNEVLIEVKASGICGTDIHIFEGGYMGSYPVIPGHEFSGIVKKIGKNVKRIKVNDHVAVEPNIACDNCWYCLNNEQNFCENWQAVGVTLPGGMAQYVKAPEKAVFNIGELSFLEGAFMEPLSCVLHGIEKLNLKIAEKVLIVGAGPIGLLLMQVLASKGISEINVIEVNKNRAASAEKMGANKRYLSFKECTKKNFDIIVDATGIPKVMGKCIDLSRMGGKILLFGVPPMNSQVTFDAFQIFRKGLRLMSSFTSVRNSYQAISLLQSGQINVKELVSHQLPLNEFEKGIKIIKSKTENSMKIMILPENH